MVKFQRKKKKWRKLLLNMKEETKICSHGNSPEICRLCHPFEKENELVARLKVDMNEKKIEGVEEMPSLEKIKITGGTHYAGQFGFPVFSATKTSAAIHNWIGCREVFSHSFKKKIEEFAFSHKKGVGLNIQAFINAFEQKLRLKKNKTLIHLTSSSTVSIVVVPEWWRKYAIRRQLFTILLRAGQNYEPKKDNFEKALYSDPYATATKEAVKSFLNRHTFCKKNQINHKGWRETFGGKKRADIEKILQRPPPKKEIAELPAEINLEGNKLDNVYENKKETIATETETKNTLANEI